MAEFAFTLLKSVRYLVGKRIYQVVRSFKNAKDMAAALLASRQFDLNKSIIQNFRDSRWLAYSTLIGTKLECCSPRYVYW